MFFLTDIWSVVGIGVGLLGLLIFMSTLQEPLNEIDAREIQHETRQRLIRLSAEFHSSQVYVYASIFLPIPTKINKKKKKQKYQNTRAMHVTGTDCQGQTRGGWLGGLPGSNSQQWLSLLMD